MLLAQKVMLCGQSAEKTFRRTNPSKAGKSQHAKGATMSDPQTTNLAETRQTDRYKFFAMMDDFIYQLEDDVLREKMEDALKRERSRYEGTNEARGM